MDSTTKNAQIAKNTLFLYFRMLFTMCIGLFTSRVNLESLGIEDFGIFNAIGGIVAMFSVFSNSLAASISRFLTFELGKKDTERLKKVFSTAVTIQIGIAVLIAILAEIIGVWFLNVKMNIPSDRLVAANWVFHFSVLTFAVNLISVPYNAAIIAHEKMSAFAYISLFEVIIKLLICYSLFISPVDKLILFSVLLFVLALCLRLIYGFYCKYKFSECSYCFVLDKKLLKQMYSFAGWSSFTMIAYTFYNSGLNILLNLFFGPVINAARGIASQVQNAIFGFCRNFQMALNPQIIKSYAENDLQRMYSLIYAGSKFSFFLMYFLSLPIILEANFILSLWLVEVPDSTVIFVRLILIIVVVDSLGGPLYCAQQATGRIRTFQILTGSLMLMILPLSYVSLKLGGKPEIVFIIYLTILSIVQVLSAMLIHRMLGMPFREYFNEVIAKIGFVILTSLPLPILATMFLPKQMFFIFIACVICILSVSFSIYWVGLKAVEKCFLNSRIKSAIGRIMK